MVKKIQNVNHLRNSEDKLPNSQIYIKFILLVYQCQLWILLYYVYNLALERRKLLPVKQTNKQKLVACTMKVKGGKDTEIKNKLFTLVCGQWAPEGELAQKINK